MNLRDFLAQAETGQLIDIGLDVVRSEMRARYPLALIALRKYEPDIRDVLTKILQRWQEEMKRHVR